MLKKRCFIVVFAVLAALSIPSVQAQAYTVTGNVDNPGEYSTEGSLWAVLQGSADAKIRSSDWQFPCADVTTFPCITLPNPPYPQNDINHNLVDTNYLIVTGRDGHRAIYGVGEINPKFAPAGSEVTITCHRRGCDLEGLGRSVKNIENIKVVQSVPGIHWNGKEGGASTPFTHYYSSVVMVSGEGITPKMFKLADLEALPQQVTLDDSSYKTNAVGIWHGPTLFSVLRAAGVDTKDMDSYVVAQATDGYATVLPMYEVTHKIGAEYVLLATRDTLNNSINCSLNGGTCAKGDGGVARIVIPADIMGGRWPSNIFQIIVNKIPDARVHCFGGR